MASCSTTWANERALAIRQKVLGPEHPDTVRSRENLADGWEWDAKENWRNVPAPNYKGKYLQLEFTVEDAGVFTTPWTATMTYGRGAGNWPETVIQWYPGKDAAIPRTDKPDF